MTEPSVSAVVFDLGGVLIDWNPRYLYRSLIADEREMETFLAEVCTPEWNGRLDAGGSWDEAVEKLASEHPAQRDLIVAFHERWDEMLGGAIDESVELLRELRSTNVRLFALSNWSAEKFPIARARYPFLAWFEAIVVSGEVGFAKPDPRIFRHLFDRHELEPRSTVFIDDWQPNIAAASDLGMIAIRFEGAQGVRRRLRELGVKVETGSFEPVVPVDSRSRNSSASEARSEG